MRKDGTPFFSFESHDLLLSHKSRKFDFLFEDGGVVVGWIVLDVMAMHTIYQLTKIFFVFGLELACPVTVFQGRMAVCQQIVFTFRLEISHLLQK